MIADNELLEYAEYVGNYYGTSLKVIQEHLEKGQDVLLDIEVQGASKVKAPVPGSSIDFYSAAFFGGAGPPPPGPQH